MHASEVLQGEGTSPTTSADPGALRLFFFSGTGNAKNVASWIVAVWKERGRRAEAIDLARAGGRAVELGPADELGIASPTHGFNYPPITLRFLFALPRAPARNRAFLVNTRAGVRFFGVCLPGLSGVAQLLAALILLLKGYRLVGMRPIDLPSNWISLHPGLKPENVRAIQERCARIARRFAGKLLDGRRELRALWDLPVDLLIAPISLGYYLIGRFIFAKSFIASRACDSCEACVKQCPVQALKLVDGRPFWTWRCESCMRCMNQCPRRAIETAHGFILVVSVLFSVTMSAAVIPLVHSLVPASAHAGWAGKLARNVAEPILMMALLFAAYRGLHRALRWRYMERLVVATSLTHFRFWRRYRAPRTPEPGASPDARPASDSNA